MFAISSYSNDFPEIEQKNNDIQHKSISTDTDSHSNNMTVLTPKEQNLFVYTTIQSTKSEPHQDSKAQLSKLIKKEKEQLCKTFSKFGQCGYGSKCMFAHGSHQLKQNKGPNKKYKTRLCNNFHKEGYCPYGNRCNYIHHEFKTESKPIDNVTDIFNQYLEILLENNIKVRKESRLLKLLQGNQI